METGATLRQAREAANLTIAALAARTGYTRAHLGNVERGCRRVTPEVVLAYGRALGEHMDRRDVLAAGAATIVAPAAVAELIRHGFSAALRGSVEDWAERVHRYGHDYLTQPVATTRHRLTSDLVLVQQHMERPGLWAAAARMLVLYGKTTPDTPTAIDWYRVAVEAADRSGDEDTRVWVRGRAALGLSYDAAELTVAGELSTAAINIANGRPSLGLLNALVAQAHILGARGELAEAMRADDVARRMFDLAATDDEVSDFNVPYWRLEVFRSMLYARLGHPRAEAAGTAAARHLPREQTRFATHIELHRALTMARGGDRTNGVAHARRVMSELPPERHSLSLRLMLQEVERRRN